MPNATILAKYVNPPKQEGWSWSIKTVDGKFFSFKPEKTPIEQGKTYDIEFTEKPRSSGGVFRDIIKRAAATAIV